METQAAPPPPRPASQAAPSRATIARLITLLVDDADLAKVEEEFRLDPVLSYRLLRFVNSAASGFLREITSYRQAITVLGYHQLHKWMVVLLVTAQESGARSEVVKSSLIRGRFLELVGVAHFGKGRADDMFMVGVFSRLGEILGSTQEAALEPLSLGDEIRAALLQHAGFYGQTLRLAEAIEAADEPAVDAMVEALSIDFQIVYDSYNAACDWADSLPV